jgi:hypothetical protein
MCYERYERRRRESDESRAMWDDFVRTEPLTDPEPPAEAGEPEPAEAREQVAAPDR